MNVHIFGRATRRGFKLTSDHDARVVLSFRTTPLDGSVMPPDLHGSTTIEHDAPVVVQVQLWAIGEDAVAELTAAEVLAAAAEGDERCVLRWSADLVAETATRKCADSNGGEVIEYRATLDLTFPPGAPFNAHLPGRLAGQKSASIAIVRRQGEIMLLEDLPRQRARADDRQPGLPLEVQADEDVDQD